MGKRKIDIRIDNKPLKLEEVIKRGVFSIPRYQRNYSWTEDNWEELIESIENNQENFLGTIFLMKRSNRKFNDYEIIDGQQRITTIQLLIKSFELVLRNKIALGIFKTSRKTEDYLDYAHLCMFETASTKHIARLSIQDLKGAQSEFRALMDLELLPDSKTKFASHKKDKDDLMKNLRDQLIAKKETLKRLKESLKTGTTPNQEKKIQTEINKNQDDFSTLKGEIEVAKNAKKEIIKLSKEYSLDSKKKYDTQKSLIGAVNYFIDILSKKDIKNIFKFYDSLMDNQFMILMETEDKNAVYEYFKSLNSTGVTLATSDILKNNLFESLPTDVTKSDKVIDEFDNIVTVLSANNLSLEEFFLNSINSRSNAFEISSDLKLGEKPINKKNLLKAYDIVLKKYQKTNRDGASSKLVKELTKDLEHYKIIMAPASNLKLTDEEFYFYNLIRQIVPSKPISFLLASRKKNSKANHLKLCKIAVYVAIRHAIMPKRDMKELAEPFYDGTRELFKGGFKASKAVFKKAKSYTTKDITHSDFALWNWSNAQALSLNCLLYRDEIIKAPRNTFNYSQLSAEHIMPQNPNEETKKYWHSDTVLNIEPSSKKNKEKYNQFAQQIGNYIILWGGDNSKVGNKPFSDKKKVYINYPYPHIKKIGKKKDWSQKEILSRSKKMYEVFESLKN
jgi:uncharacterized protein with ParB-like and HNH nuclease domain